MKLKIPLDIEDFTFSGISKHTSKMKVVSEHVVSICISKNQFVQGPPRGVPFPMSFL